MVSSILLDLEEKTNAKSTSLRQAQKQRARNPEARGINLQRETMSAESSVFTPTSFASSYRCRDGFAVRHNRTRFSKEKTHVLTLAIA
jgi:hypothetical protein